jgi:hypothetical protein
MKALALLLMLVQAVWWLAGGQAHPLRAVVILGILFVAFVTAAVVVAHSARARAAILRLRERRGDA